MTILHEWFTWALALFPHPYLLPLLGAIFGGEETIIVISALAASGGALSFWEMLIMAFIGTMVSDWAWFLFGGYASAWLEHRPRIHKRLDAVAEFVSHLTGRRHFLALLITKFLYGTRIIMLFYLAREHVPFWRFTYFNTIVTGIWATIICIIGWAAGRGIVWIAHVFGDISLALGLLVIGFLILHGVRVWLSKTIVEGEHQ